MIDVGDSDQSNRGCLSAARHGENSNTAVEENLSRIRYMKHVRMNKTEVISLRSVPCRHQVSKMLPRLPGTRLLLSSLVFSSWSHLVLARDILSLVSVSKQAS